MFATSKVSKLSLGIVYRRCAFAFACVLLNSGGDAAVIQTVFVGDSVNVADTRVMNDGTTGYGAVNYNYRIGKFEVTNAEYAEFLNFKAVSDPLELYSPLMASEARGGILRQGAVNAYAYVVKPNMANKPVNYVDWYDAIRFANWLHNGQANGSTETGAYTLLGGTPIPNNFSSISRMPGATWVLPSEDEWYKAAYYSPSANGSAGGYFEYPTQSNIAPTAALANAVGDISNPGSNVSNYDWSADWNGEDGNVTTVGSAGVLSASFYGTFDQGGNVSEWNEELFLGGSHRGLRGGAWGGTGGAINVSASTRGFPGGVAAGLPDVVAGFAGFRVARVFVPEPTSLMLGVWAVVGLLSVRRHLLITDNLPS